MSRWILPLALCASYAAAQTFTDCNPRFKTCPDDPALGTTYETSFNESMTEMDPDFFNVTAGADLITFSDKGADLTINKQGDSVTIKTKFYIMFGRVEVMYQAAAGQGIISTINLLSNTLDEIDVENMGGNSQNVTTNFFGWEGKLLKDGENNNKNISVTDWSGGSMGGMHNYTVDWSQDKMEWFFDGESVRVEPYQPPGYYPQSPCYLNIGIWAGGDPTLNYWTRVWAGGDTDYSKGPFTMTVQSVKITDSHQNVSSYHYGDQSGSWESIKAIDGESDAYKAMHQKSFSEKTQEQWDGLSTGAKIGIAAGIGGTFLLAFVLFVFYCMRQRRQGKAEKALADAAWEKQQQENVEMKGQLAAYQKQMAKGQFAVSHMGHGERF